MLEVYQSCKLKKNSVENKTNFRMQGNARDAGEFVFVFVPNYFQDVRMKYFR